MPTKHFILGAISRHPAHGYKIKKYYQEFINPDKKLNDAQLYPLLREMEQQGLVKREVETQESGPSRKVISITKKGKEEFENWLRSDAGETLSSRPKYDFLRAMPLLVKFPFFYKLDDRTVLEKIENQRTIYQARLEDLKRARESMIKKKLEPSKIQVIDFGIMHEETILKWLEDVSKQYGKGKGRKGVEKDGK